MACSVNRRRFRRVFVAGLGNPGRRYSGTRHNCGFRVVDGLVEALGAVDCGRDPKARWHTWEAWRGDQHFRLLKPLTYMNRSGESVAEFLDTTGDEPDLRLFISDDINLPVGGIRLREKGGSGGHKGLDSLIRHLGEEGVGRLRIGVGLPVSGIECADYVLKPVSPVETEFLRQAEARAIEVILCLADFGWEEAMTRFNTKAAPDM